MAVGSCPRALRHRTRRGPESKRQSWEPREHTAIGVHFVADSYLFLPNPPIAVNLCISSDAIICFLRNQP